MSEISPTYYAAGITVGDYELRGANFNQIPMDAVGVLASNNDLPLENRDVPQAILLFDIVSRTDTEMLMRQRTTISHGVDNYLGAILSADRQTVYWVNETRPLP